MNSPSITVLTVECPRCSYARQKFSIPQPLRADRRYQYEAQCVSCEAHFSLRVTVTRETPSADH